MSEQVTNRPRIGDYEILAKLSFREGMGDVLLVRRSGVHRFEKLAAVKIIRASMPNYQHMRTMFLDEARLMARINHPTIAQVYDFGEDNKRLFLVMEYVSGISFKELIERVGTSDFLSARAMAEVCLGLHVAHQLTDFSGKPLGVVHRDVSPQNLMLTFDGSVKILDFGIALMRDRETQATQCGEVKGKPAYMAPEQVKNKPVDHRSDVFAAAIVLHELLTGYQLFQGESIYAIARAVELAKIPPPSKLVGPMPPGLDEVVMRGLQRNPDKRYQNAQEMAQAINGVLSTIRGETLEQYAPRELAQGRIRYLEWMQKILSGDEVSQVTGRPDGIATAQMPADVSIDTLDEKGPVDESQIPARRAKTATRKNRTVLWLSLAVLAGAIAAGAYLFLPDLLEVEPGPVPSTIDAEPDPKPPPPTETDNTNTESPETAQLGLDLTGDDPPTVETEEVPRPKPRRKRRHKRRRRPKPHKPPPVAVAPVEPEPPPPDPPADTWAFITIAADPYANVRIDGKEIGTTPIFRRKVRSGAHKIVLISPDTGTVRYDKKLNLAENEHKKVILH